VTAKNIPLVRLAIWNANPKCSDIKHDSNAAMPVHGRTSAVMSASWADHNGRLRIRSANQQRGNRQARYHQPAGLTFHQSP
jgi:hypothetical protein